MPARAVGTNSSPSGAVSGNTRVGLLDIGSSSIRLVIYRAGGRLPHPQFNEREVCRLGAGLEDTGRLDPERIRHALAALRRFAIIARGSGLDRLDVFATEAVRKAGNRDEFLGPAEETLGCPVRLLSGPEEARYAALGVVSGFSGVDGIVADLGGGSLELQPVEDGKVLDAPASGASMPLGHLTAHDAGTVAEVLQSLDWIKRFQGRRLYAVGGAFRAVATAYSAQSRKRLDLVHGLALPMPKLRKITDAIAEADGEMEGIPPARRSSMKQAVLVIGCLVDALQPREVVFSGYGVREGFLYEHLPAEQAAIDPLIAGAREYAEMWQRHDGLGEALERVVAEFAAVLPAPTQRLARATALLADMAWLDFPDYRGPLALEKMLGLSVVGITHSERVWMAAALYARYRGRLPGRGILKPKLAREEGRSACYIGLVLRMLMNLTGGLPELLNGLRVESGQKALTLVLGEGLSGLESELLERRLEAVMEFSSVDIRVR